MKYGAEGYGIYFMIIEKLRENADYKCVKDYNIIAFDLRVGASIVKSIVEDFGLFAFADVNGGEYIYSKSLLQRMNPLDELRKKRSDAGKAGMLKRYESKESQQSDNSVTTVLQQSDNNKSKVKKSKEDITPPPTPAPESGGEECDEKTWKNDFEAYKVSLRAAYKALINDKDFIAERERYHPGLNIKLSLEKACKDFWATEAGWKRKKQSKIENIDWKATLRNALDQKSNHVWLKKGEANEGGTEQKKVGYV